MKIAYDIKLMRPGCPLVQAAMGGSSTIGKVFPPDKWLLFQTPDMHLYEIGKKQLDQLVKMSIGSEDD